MDFFECHYYNINRVLLSLIGQWPYQEAKSRRVRKAIVLFILLTSVPGQLGKFITTECTTELIFDLVPTIIITYDSLTVCQNFNYNSARVCRNDYKKILENMGYKLQVKSLLEQIESDWEMCEEQEDVNVMKVYADDSRMYTKIYITYSYVAISTFLILPLVPEIIDTIAPLNESRPRSHPFVSEYVVDPQQYFHLILFHMSFVAFVIITCVITSDTTFIMLVHHACGKFAVLGNYLDRALRHPPVFSNENSKVDKKSIYEQVVFCVKRHRQAIQFASLIELFYAWPLFIQIGLNIVCMSLTLTRVTLWLGDRDKIMQTIAWIFGQTVHVFVMSYPGQMLLVHSQQVSERLYYTDWHKAPVKVQKLLKLIMRRCLEPCCVTVGKMIVLSLENFLSVLQTSVSYCVVLSSLQ